MCCDKSGIMMNVEMAEGKDHPRELGASEFADHGGKIVGLLLRMLKKYFSLSLILVSVF